MVLNNLLGALKENEVFIPNLTFADLRNSKMALEYLRSFENDIAAHGDKEVKLRQEMELQILRLRDTLMVWAEEKLGVEYRSEWDKRFQDAIEGITSIAATESQVPITDLPREKDVDFFRIRLPDDIPVEIISELAEECEVLISLDGDRHLQVSGKKECVQNAKKRLGELFYGESKLQN